MVEAPLTARLQRWWPAAAGAGALLFVAVMLITGSRPESRQLVKFEANGIMRLAPERITRAEIRFGDRTLALSRTGEKTWSRDGRIALDAGLAARLSMAIQFMNTSEPVRELSAEELQGTELHEYGLDQPRLSVSLFEGSTQVLTARFGVHNPGGLLQYMTVDGRQEVFLMSRFVGEQWEHVAQELASK